MVQLKWIPRLLRWMSPVRRGLQEAADQHLGKATKLQTFNDLTMARDLQELAEEDRTAVAQFRRQRMKVPASADSGGSNRDSWVCDDMTINTGRSSLPEILLVLAAAGLAFWYLGKPAAVTEPGPQLNPEPAAMAPPFVSGGPIDSEYEVRIYDQNGQLVPVHPIAELPKQPAKSP